MWNKYIISEFPYYVRFLNGFMHSMSEIKKGDEIVKSYHDGAFYWRKQLEDKGYIEGADFLKVGEVNDFET